ncbi:potassium channel family protein [Pseudoponticoccus marisrubri]|uniref:Potassium channel protein n=1 Tax=Pseudoponticoccus marisrubri TaxID=1685382 RepID=A0A0W7WM11_9RHOB|nr:potassium channel family protein [Pseudoponticoccus marisrubri]KUF11627.1 potassium channel protein [Pseudoponticoccus marisrubri]
MNRLRLATLLGTLAVLIASGTVFFRYVEGWSWLDAYFFTVVTLSTVGYGELVPMTPAGRIGTTVFILIGLGIFAVAVQQFGLFAMRKREEHTEWLIARLGHKEAPPANADDAPDTPARPGPRGDSRN